MDRRGAGKCNDSRSVQRAPTSWDWGGGGDSPDLLSGSSPEEKRKIFQKRRSRSGTMEIHYDEYLQRQG